MWEREVISLFSESTEIICHNIQKIFDLDARSQDFVFHSGN